MTPYRRITSGLFLAVLLVAAWGVRAPLADGYANGHLLVETGDLAVLLNEPGLGMTDDLRIIDVRPAEDYAAGHIPGAIHLGADDVIDPASHVDGALYDDETLAAMLGARGIDKDTRVILYDDNGGFHASRLFWMLEYLGHRDAAILNGGWPKWQGEGHAVSTETPDVESVTFAVTLTPRRLATADWLLSHRGDSNVVVIDVRPTSLYAKGHIPWAQNIPWKQNLTDNDVMRPADELIAHFAAHGVTDDKVIAVHCQNGKAAGHTYFTLRLLGFPQVRSYDRSWAEWGTAGDLPVAIEAGG